jgi:XRE family aerobic/anaerobic benzoate catabolism transcriptional regulator
MTRRALAGQSGVSERYIAQLERGDGNASILVLQKIAGALGMRPAELLDDPYPGSVEYTLLCALLRELPADTLGRLRQRLQGELGAGAAVRTRRIALLGLRGAGKSTLGARLAESRQVPFVELDREIERRSGTPLEELFLIYGQATYRRHEERCLAQVLNENPECVIATGGSIVTAPTVFATLLSSCFTVWLKATPEEHMARVIAQGDMRPMAGNAEAMEDLRQILLERAPLYAQSEFTLDTSGLSTDEAFHSLTQALQGATAEEQITP